MNQRAGWRMVSVQCQAVALLCSTSVSSAQTTGAGGVRDSSGAQIVAIIASGRLPTQRWPLLSDVTPDLHVLYSADSAVARWSAAGRATASAERVVQQLELIEARGLTPDDYDVGRLRALAAAPLTTRAAQAEFDVMMSTASLRALRALRYGRVSASAAHAQLQFAREPYDAVAALRRMQHSANPALQFDQAEPPFLHYHLLKDAMARYRQLARDSTLLPVRLLGTLRPAAIDAGVPAVRRLLIALGDVPSAAMMAPDSLVYDSVLVAGVKRFQLRQGLSADGVVGPATLSRLQRPFAARVEQIALTLERWRWLPHAISDPPPIIVNIPAFRLHAFTTNSDRESELISMDVVVGQAFNHRTPVFSGSLRYLVFSPYWDVPPSITRNEILPRARRDRGYLARGNYEVVSNGGAILGTSAAAVSAVGAGRARIRQKPGPDNSLGGVKFIFPNAFNVYLHDTPAQQVFTRARRDASHGCIRIANPARLAAFLLRDQAGFDSTRIARAMTQTRPEQVNLTRPVPVHIVYATAVAREDGVVLFHDDIYGHDRSLGALLARGYPYENSRR